MGGRHLLWLAAVVSLVLLTTPESASGRDPRGSRRRRGPSCLPHGDSNDWSSALTAAVKDSETVFTGKVLEKDEDAVGRFRVRLKRVTKGEEWLKGLKEVWVRQGTSCKGSNGRKGSLRVRDTVVFLGGRLQQGGEEDLELTVGPVPLTLRNLDIVNAAAKDMTYKPRSAIMEEPCEKTFCPFGAICESDGGEGRCRCPDEEECPPPLPPPSHALAPDASPPADNRHLLNPPPPLASTQVCGTDGETYASECLLRVRACRRPQLRLRVAHAGICGGSSTGHRRG